MDGDPVEIAKSELKKLTCFIKALHQSSDKNEPPTTHFYFRPKKSGWYTNIPINLTCEKNGSNIFTFKTNHKYHHLNYTLLNQEFPRIEVVPEFKGKVEICWPHNLGWSAIIVRKTLIFDGVPAQSFDNITLDIIAQNFLRRPSERAYFNKMIGNIPFLQEWSDVLPSYVTNAPQPFYYEEDEATSVPICLSKSRMTIRCEMRNKIKDLLRMRVRNKLENGWSEWKEINFNPVYIKGMKMDDVLPDPSITGKCSYITSGERTYLQDEQKKDGIFFYIPDVIEHNTSNPVKLGQTVDIDLHTSTPCISMHYVAQNLKAKSKNNYANYTTNAENLFKGWNPIQDRTLKYAIDVKLPNTNENLLRYEHWYHMRSCPTEEGYGVYSFANNPKCLNITQSGVVLDDLKAKLSLTLGDTNPFKGYSEDINELKKNDGELIPREIDPNYDEKDKENEQEYMVHVRLFVIQKLQFTESKCEIIKCVD
jgi:hypothetical protein